MMLTTSLCWWLILMTFLIKAFFYVGDISNVKSLPNISEWSPISQTCLWLNNPGWSIRSKHLGCPYITLCRLHLKISINRLNFKVLTMISEWTRKYFTDLVLFLRKLFQGSNIFYMVHIQYGILKSFRLASFETLIAKYIFILMTLFDVSIFVTASNEVWNKIIKPIIN